MKIAFSILVYQVCLYFCCCKCLTIQSPTCLFLCLFSGNLTDYTVFERITLNWSPSSHIVWTHGWRTLKTVCDKDPIYSDIDSEAILIKKRALSGYGLRVRLMRSHSQCIYSFY